jgi:hypothetical protein
MDRSGHFITLINIFIIISFHIRFERKTYLPSACSFLHFQQVRVQLAQSFFFIKMGRVGTLSKELE